MCQASHLKCVIPSRGVKENRRCVHLFLATVDASLRFSLHSLNDDDDDDGQPHHDC